MTRQSQIEDSLAVSRFGCEDHPGADYAKVMRQVVQHLKSGKVTTEEVPAPVIRPGFVRVRTLASVISAGTERLTVEAAQRGLIGRALDQPALVKQVIDRARTDGILNTFDKVRSKLGSLRALGYSSAGTIIEVGPEVSEFRVGDRVACAGVGYASHAEVNTVPKNLCAKIPDKVTFEEAAFTTLGAIAMQGVRLAEPTLSESIVVIGLGLIGQITVQLLKANGCRVFGIDLDPSRIDLARSLGAGGGCVPDEAASQVPEWSRGRGADAVLITAATESNEPLELAGSICRQKGRVIVIGAVGLRIPRQPFYERELTFRISMSYGPGRYDPQYEELGYDYPFGYVRWTEKRNLEAFLDLVADRRLNLEPLITHRFEIEHAEQAYQLITAKDESFIGVLLRYDDQRALPALQIPIATKPHSAANRVSIGLIGAGAYAKGMLLPQFKAAGAEFQSITTASGVSARIVAEQFGFRFCAPDAGQVIDDDEANLIVIATPHDTHAEFVRQALEKNRDVFVEKPLALTDGELTSVTEAAERSQGRLMVGFNRRFSPLAAEARNFFKDRSTPLSINYRVNAGRVPRDHWAHDIKKGGGRIVGEVCHFIDFIHFITGSLVTRVYAEAISANDGRIVNEDSVFITMRLADGSNGAIAYLAEGDKALPKERIEIFGAGASLVIDDFRSASAFRNGREKKTRLREQDKGQSNQARAISAVVLQGKPAPISLQDLVTTTRATFRIRESLQTAAPVDV